MVQEQNMVFRLTARSSIRHSRMFLAGIQKGTLGWIPAKNMRE
jgi:hypothetical protein